MSRWWMKRTTRASLCFGSLFCLIILGCPMFLILARLHSNPGVRVITLIAGVSMGLYMGPLSFRFARYIRGHLCSYFASATQEIVYIHKGLGGSGKIKIWLSEIISYSSPACGQMILITRQGKMRLYSDDWSISLDFLSALKHRHVE